MLKKIEIKFKTPERLQVLYSFVVQAIRIFFFLKNQHSESIIINNGKENIQKIYGV